MSFCVNRKVLYGSLGLFLLGGLASCTDSGSRTVSSEVPTEELGIEASMELDFSGIVDFSGDHNVLKVVLWDLFDETGFVGDANRGRTVKVGGGDRIVAVSQNTGQSLETVLVGGGDPTVAFRVEEDTFPGTIVIDLERTGRGTIERSEFIVHWLPEYDDVSIPASLTLEQELTVGWRDTDGVNRDRTVRRLEVSGPCIVDSTLYGNSVSAPFDRAVFPSGVSSPYTFTFASIFQDPIPAPSLPCTLDFRPRFAIGADQWDFVPSPNFANNANPVFFAGISYDIPFLSTELRAQ